MSTSTWPGGPGCAGNGGWTTSPPRPPWRTTTTTTARPAWCWAFAGNPARLTLRDRLFADQAELFTGEPLPYATLCCVWDGQAAPETVLPCARSSRIRYLVVESGSAGAGQWHAYRRNLMADFQRVFGEPPDHTTGGGVLTDSDDLKGRAEAWYGDLVIE